MQRRTLLALAAAGAGAMALPPAAAHPTWEGLRRLRRPQPTAPHRVHQRELPGRVWWVVPLGLAIGQELLHENQRVRVRALWQVQVDGAPREMARVVDAAGLARDVEIVRDGAA